MLDTTQVPIGPGGRRELRFATLDEMLGDARACVDADGASRLIRRGNWTIGQALHHIAAWIDYPLLGYPAELVIPAEFQAQARAHKDRILRETMRPGEELPGLESAGGTLATEAVSGAAGLAHIHEAAARLCAGEPGSPTPFADPAFGVITYHDWTEMTLRHAELHLSFFVPSGTVR